MKVNVQALVGACVAGASIMTGVPALANEVPNTVVNEQDVDQNSENEQETAQEIPELKEEEKVNEGVAGEVNIDETPIVSEDDGELAGEGTSEDDGELVDKGTSENIEPSIQTMLEQGTSDLTAMTDEQMMSLFRKYIGEDNWNDDYRNVFQDYFLDNVKDSDVQTVTVGGVTYKKVSDNSQIDEQIASVINFIREINGLSPVTVSDTYNFYAQEAVDYLAENNLDIDHYAADGVSGAEDAKTGLHGSNLAQGYYSNMMEMVDQLFGDDDAYNRTILGHRAWFLDPTLTTIGVGYAQRSDDTELLSVFVAESSSTRSKDVKETVEYVWPNSGICAYELLSETACSSTMPWSIALGSDYEDYLNDHPNALDNLKITITDENGKAYTIDTNIDDVSDPSTNYLTFGDWFTVETIYSSQIGYIRIGFNPGSMYKDYVFKDNGNGTYSQKGYSALKGHKFTVKVEGFEDDIEYTVDFVSMVEMIEEAVETKKLVNGVEDLIDAIDDNVSVDSKDAIDKALAAYDKLTDAQKSLVDSAKVTKMNEAKTACDAAIKEAELAKKAADAIAKIDAIPETVNLDCADQVLIAKQAYNALDSETKTYLQGKTQYTKLTGADQTLLDICSNALSNVNDLIDAIPSDITVDDETAITDARTAYDALPTYDVDYKTKVTSERASKLGNAESTIIIVKKEASDKAAAKTVVDLITALPSENDIALTDETAITEARTAYNALTGDQKAYVTNYSKLTDAELKVEQLKAQQKADQEAANEVSSLIEALPETPTLDDKDQVDTVYTKYTAMSNAQKLLVSMSDYNKLIAAKNTVDDLYKTYLENKANADTVTGKINALPTIVTVDDETAINDARTAYDALNVSAKGLVEQAALKKLTDAEAALSQAKQVIKDKAAAKTVNDLIDALPVMITDEDVNDVEGAKEAYDALTDAQKLYITSETKSVLDNAVAAVAEIKKQAAADAAKAAEIEEIINDLKKPADMVYGDHESVKSAKDAYDALTTKQKNFVSANAKTTLTNAVNKANELIEKHNTDVAKANEVIEIINALPTDIATTDESAVNEAKSAYEALTDDQKALVTESSLTKLNDSIEGLRIAKVKAEADRVTELIDALPETIQLKDETAIKNAAKAYDALTDEGKSFVSKDTVDKLANAQKGLDQAKENASNQEKADAVSEVINALPTEITLDNEDAVENARSLYNGLTAAQKLYVSEATLTKLTDAEQAIAQAHKVADDMAKAKEVSDLINAIPATITSKDLTSIQAVESAYNALTDDQKAYVSADDKERLDDAVETVNKAVQKEIDDIKAATKVENAVYALPAVDKMKYTDNTAVYEAKNAYDALTDDQKALVSEKVKTALTDAVNKADALVKKHNDDVSEANKVTNLIDALPDDVTLDDESNINAAKSAYDALTDDQKEFVSSDKVSVLNDCLASLKALKDQAAADSAVGKIDMIPETVTCDDETVINDAVTAYDNLNDEAKALVGNDKVQKLKNSVKALDEAKVIKANKEAAAEITNEIADIPENVTLKNKRIILLALAGYKELTPAQKMYISEADLAKLMAAVNTIDKLEAEAVEEQFKVLPDIEDITLDDDTLLAGLRSAYDALSDGSKAVFDEDLLNQLQDAEVKIKALKQEKADKESAEQVTDLIEALKDPDDLTLGDKNAVYTIYQTYKSMTDNAMTLLSQANINKIENCFARMNALVEADKIAKSTGINDSPDTGIETNNLTLMLSALLGIIGIGAAGVFVKNKKEQE